MTPTPQHRGYYGCVSHCDGKLMVSIEGIRDIVITSCGLNADIEAVFAELVDDYIAVCENVGKLPEKVESES